MQQGRRAPKKFSAPVFRAGAGDAHALHAQRDVVARLHRCGLLTKTGGDMAEAGSELWERRNKAFHEALIAGFDSTWSKYLLSILYRHAERYRNINWRLTASQASGRNVHREHEDIFLAAINRQEARAALARQAHVRLTHDVVKRQAQLK